MLSWFFEVDARCAVSDAATMNHADIRGLVTTGHRFVAEAASL